MTLVPAAEECMADAAAVDIDVDTAQALHMPQPTAVAFDDSVGKSPYSLIQ